MKPSMPLRWGCEGVAGRSAAGVLEVRGPQPSQTLARGIESVRCDHPQMRFSERATEDASPGDRRRWLETEAGTSNTNGRDSVVTFQSEERAEWQRCSRESPLRHRPLGRRLVHQLASPSIRLLGDGRVSPRGPSVAVDDALCRGPQEEAQ
jgi:hypothetical protein